jgi:hypothetical protein
VMPGVRRRIAGMCHPHVAQPEATPERALDTFAVGRSDDVKVRILGCGRLARRSRGRRKLQEGRQHQPPCQHLSSSAIIASVPSAHRGSGSVRTHRNNPGLPGVCNSGRCARTHRAAHVPGSPGRARPNRRPVRHGSSCASNPRPTPRDRHRCRGGQADWPAGRRLSSARPRLASRRTPCRRRDPVSSCCPTSSACRCHLVPRTPIRLR